MFNDDIYIPRIDQPSHDKHLQNQCMQKQKGKEHGERQKGPLEREVLSWELREWEHPRSDVIMKLAFMVSTMLHCIFETNTLYTGHIRYVMFIRFGQKCHMLSCECLEHMKR